MNDEIQRSRLRISRRKALSLGGTVGLGSLLAACGSGDGGGSSTATVTTNEGASATVEPTTTAGSDVVALLDAAPTCTLAQEQTQGPYWFDVDSIRSDVREDRPGTPLALALRVQDMSKCAAGGAAAPVANAVVEIWHCDAGGDYSGFESGAVGGGGGAPPGDAPPGDGGGPDGAGPGGGGPPGIEGGAAGGGAPPGGAAPEGGTGGGGAGGGGAQATDKRGIAQFTTIYPGWYQGRTVHVHLKVHVDKATVLTTQLYFDESLNTAVFATAPYDERSGRDTFIDDDSIYDATGLLAVSRDDDGYLGVINLGVGL